MEEEKTQETSTEQKTEETIEEKEPTVEELKKEVETLKADGKGWQDTAAKWRRKYDDSEKVKTEKPPETAPEAQGDPLAPLREKYDMDPFSTSVQMTDRAARHYANTVREEIRKENKVKRQLRRDYKDFDEYENRVDDFMGKMASDKRTQDMYEMAYKVAKTEALEETDLNKVKKEAKEEGLKEGAEKTFEEAKEMHTASAPRGGAAKESKTVSKLTPEEEKMAARYGMTNEQWAKSKAQKIITGGEKARLEK